MKRFKHDCDKCNPIEVDMYYCPATGSIVMRYGDEGSEYFSAQKEWLVLLPNLAAQFVYELMLRRRIGVDALDKE